MILKKTMFDLGIYTGITKSRLEHLTSLNLPLENSTVLEVGAGVGYLTSYFENLGCRVLSTDAREENNIEHRKRFPQRDVRYFDLDSQKGKEFGSFDIVFCYGTLYHLSNPGFAIENLARLTGKFFLLETCVNNTDNGSINLTRDMAFLDDQSIYGIGCKPGRDWIMAKLKRHFPFAYITASQPANPDFPVEWPVTEPKRNLRSIFVASRERIESPLLLEKIPDKQYYFMNPPKGPL
jgi:SAM-dependent methyltransferase